MKPCMNIMLYSTGIIDIKHPSQGIMDIAGAGFTDMVLDISLYCNPLSFRDMGKKSQRYRPGMQIINHPETLSGYLKPLLDQCIRTNMQHSVAIAPYLSRDTNHGDFNNTLRQLAEESVKICGKAGCKYLIVKPLFAGIADTELWKVNRELYLHLASYAIEYDVMLLLENQCKDVNGHLVRGICSDGHTAAEWVDSLNEEAGEQCFGFCMDVGVCNLCGQNMYDFSVALGDRLKAVVLRDCDGDREKAMMPFTCVDQGQSQTDWLNLIRGLRQIEFSGNLMLNLADTATAISPILRPGLLQMAKSIADYFKWQIEIERLLKKYQSRVLFGAGNMCRNYMKCYGEQYPPLYTCDNNNSLWGTDFCGLEVKPPENLKQLPEDCAIFICNIYYREIKQQLDNMGIKNPIAYFNDEYMPTFYFDRLEDMEETSCCR